jgi:hypothetical protein
MYMAKQTFGGDDDDEEIPVEEKKKPLDLSKYSTGPDVNIREVFWTILGSYATKKEPGVDLKTLEMDRFALVRVAIGALDRPSPLYARITPNYIARYTLMMLIDAGWADGFVEFLEECLHRNKKSVILALRKLCTDEYKDSVIERLQAMLRFRENSETALKYLNELNVKEVVVALKKELIILARGDIGENQLNAISALSILDSEDVTKTMIVLLSHWDESARMAAAQVLSKSKSEDAKAAAKKRLGQESDPEIIRLLQKIAR